MPATLFGYDVINRIGVGAASSVYAVTNAQGQLFAIKHVVKKDDADDRFLLQLQNEFDVSQKFRHPVLRKSVEWKVPRRFFSSKFNEAGLVLEWVDGQPLDQNVPTDIYKLLPIFLQAGAGLASLHRLRLVHCDFKPHNVLVCEDEHVKLIDFGRTCQIGYGKHRVQGTPDFITPEQVKCVPVDAKTDIYSFGASLYWCLTGKKVPTYFTVDKHDRDIIKLQQFPTPRDLRPELPEELSKLVMHCLMYNPDRRVADMITVLNTLAPFAEPPPVVQPAVAGDAEVKKPKPRRVMDWGI